MKAKTPRPPFHPDPFISRSEAETERFGAMLADNLKAGDAVALCGDLGTGKTCLVRGICRGLGAKETVRSPTFALLNIYGSGILPVYHFDMYRLSGEDEALGAGIEEYLAGPGVCVIEWAERVKGLLPKTTLWIDFRHAGKTRREIRVRGNPQRRPRHRTD